MKYGIGCDFCESEFNLLDVDGEDLDFGLHTKLSLQTLEDGSAFLDSSTFYNNALDGDHLLYSNEYEINFCPKCGRPLNEKEALFYYRGRIKAFIYDVVLGEKSETKEYTVKALTDRAVPPGEVDLAIKELIDEGFVTPLVIGDDHYLEKTDF